MINYITDLGGHRFPNSPRYEKPVTGPTILKSQAKAGDYVFANAAGKKVIVSQDDWQSYWSAVNADPNAEYKLIAQVVVPMSHTNDGTIRCIGLARSSARCWFKDGAIGYGTIKNVLDNNSKYVVDLMYTYVTPGTTTINQTSNFAAPRGITSASSSITAYLDPFANEVRSTPSTSPYCGFDEQKNPYFYLTQLGVSNLDEKTLIENQMDGKGATEYMHDVLKEAYYKDHPEGSDDDFYNHVCTAINYVRNYSTVGTKQGDWYIPSPAELLYAVSRATTLNMTMFGNTINSYSLIASYFSKSDSTVYSKYMHSGYSIAPQELSSSASFVMPFISI